VKIVNRCPLKDFRRYYIIAIFIIFLKSWSDIPTERSMAGYEMATQNNSISEETEAGLQKELMSIPEYVKYIGM